MKNSSSVNLPIGIALLPIIFLVLLLSINVFIYGDDSLNGTNQFILILSGLFGASIGFIYKVSYKKILTSISNSVKSVTGALLILLFVGALAGTWLVSGIIPTMIYYGLQILNPTIFLPACLIICAVISVATGSSWTTSATVGIALIGIAFSGYWFRPLKKYEQIIIGIGSLFFVAPGIESMIFGLLIVSPMLFLQFLKKN